MFPLTDRATHFGIPVFWLPQPYIYIYIGWGEPLHQRPNKWMPVAIVPMKKAAGSVTRRTARPSPSGKEAACSNTSGLNTKQ